MVVDRPADGLRPVADDLVGRFARAHTGQDLLNDAHGILGARIVARDDDEIGDIRGDFPHDRAFFSVTVAAGAEEHHKTLRRDAAQRRENIFDGVRRDGIVDENAVIAVRRHRLHPPLCAVGRFKRGGGIGERYAEQARAGNGRERIVHRKLPRQVRLYPDKLALLQRAEANAARRETDIARRERGAVALGREGVHRLRRILHDRFRPRIVRIRRRLFAQGEEHRLGAGVFLHRVVEIQMILCQVCEKADGKMHARHAAQHKRVGGYLHHAVGAPGVRHPAEERLQIAGLRRGVLGVKFLAADHVRYAADETDLRAKGLFQNLLDEDGRCRLAVRAGDADDLHFAAWVAVEVPRRERETEPAVIRPDIRHIPGGRFFTQHGSAALFHRHGDIFMSVRLVSSHGDEQIAALHTAGIVADARDLRIAGGGRGENVYSFENFRKLHGTSS